MKRNIELIPFLTQVVQRNTHSYQSDFRYDLERLKEAAKETNMEDRVFYWMSRPHGTWCVLERDAFIRESSGHHIWTYYASEPEGIKAYRVTVTGQRAGEPVGDVIKLNYPEQVKRVEQNALPVSRVEITFRSGEKMVMSLERYKRDREWLFQEHGMIRHFRYCPESEAELTRRIMLEHRQQQKPRQRKQARPAPTPGR